MVKNPEKLVGLTNGNNELVSGETLGILLVHKHLKYDVNKTLIIKYKQRLNLKAELDHLILLPLLILPLS